MPYIPVSDRERIDQGDAPLTAGELNYAITRLILDYLKARPMSYHAVNEVIGVLGCVQQELYRRKAAPYEDEKARLNGDVF